VELDLRAVEQGAGELPYRDVPMPGSKQSLALLRLDSAPGSFVIHGRFPAGFDRTEPGGYAVTEEFLLLEGELVFDGVTYSRGDLVFVPANRLRTRMTTATGCTVLAWFSGPAIFVPAAELDSSTPADEGVRTVSFGATVSSESSPESSSDSEPRVLLDLPGATWWRCPWPGPLPDRSASPGEDVLDAGLTRWSRRGGGADLPAGESFVRREKP
jgi:hypothetical protein